MGDVMTAVGLKRKALGADLSSDSRKRVLVTRRDYDERTPSIFLCRHPSAAIPADSPGPLESSEKESFFKLHNTKHKIFLSHAGAEKNFVEQLCVDLEANGYFFPFFDQRNHSLPKGKDFAALIVEAAKQCHVAVVVLSETFLRSKWPMIELGKFHEARKGENPSLNVLPLFFKLSMEDLDEQSINERWMPTWQEYASTDERIDVNLWREAVKALPKVNGFIFEQQRARHKSSTGISYRSEVEYRSAVMRAILELSPPDLLYGSSETMVGYDRLCETLSGQFVEDTKSGVLLLGLYGMPGLGKTTMSKALHDYFHCELVGRVCHVDLGNSSTDLMRQKKVLKELFGLKNDVLDGVLDVDQGRTLMRGCLEQDGMKQQSAVFLAIDNVSVDEHSLDEARAYLEAGFCPKSRIMVTSRNRNIVQGLLSDSKFCKPVPGLTEEEAGTIFLKIAAPGRILSEGNDEERRSLAPCVEKCRFSSALAFDSDHQYHPLALRALANYFRNEAINKKPFSVWEKYLEDINRFYSNGLFDILKMQFESLEPTLQLFFLDIALFGEKVSLSNSYEDWVTWLGGLHIDTSRMEETKFVEGVLRQLEWTGMINLPEITMHQLYKEFAVWFVTNEISSKSIWCVGESSPPYERTRIRIVNLKGEIPRTRVKREWGSLVLLQLHSCTYLRELILTGLDRLRHLELVDLKNLETLTLPSESFSLRFVWLWGLDSLRRLPDFGSCYEFLRVISVSRCSKLREPLRIEGCSELGTLETDVRLCPQLRMSLAASLSSLRDLWILNDCAGGGGGGSWEGEELNLAGLGLCSQLQAITLANLPVKRVLGIAQVTSVIAAGISFSECPNLTEVPGGLAEASFVYMSRSRVASFWRRKSDRKIDADRRSNNEDDELDQMHGKWRRVLGSSHLQEWQVQYQGHIQDRSPSMDSESLLPVDGLIPELPTMPANDLTFREIYPSIIERRKMRRLPSVIQSLEARISSAILIMMMLSQARKSNQMYRGIRNEEIGQIGLNFLRGGHFKHNNLRLQSPASGLKRSSQILDLQPTEQKLQPFSTLSSAKQKLEAEWEMCRREYDARIASMMLMEGRAENSTSSHTVKSRPTAQLMKLLDDSTES